MIADLRLKMLSQAIRIRRNSLQISVDRVIGAAAHSTVVAASVLRDLVLAGGLCESDIGALNELEDCLIECVRLLEQRGDQVGSDLLNLACNFLLEAALQISSRSCAPESSGDLILRLTDEVARMRAQLAENGNPFMAFGPPAAAAKIADDRLAELLAGLDFKDFHS